MKKFLDEVAAALYDEYGAGISDLHLVFPGKRARLFFNEALLKNNRGKPIWQPHYLSIDDMVRGVSGLEPGDHLRLVAELYKIYVHYHEGESFDRFYRWGEMLLSDFDTIDKYMIDAEALYTNVSDLKEIEDRFSMLFEEDEQALELAVNFWRAFNTRAAKSAEQQQFLKIWRSLYEIYGRYKKRLRELGIAYPGMIYREVAEGLNTGGLDSRFAGKTYCFVGFNALNECEQRMFDHLGEHGAGRFYWDYDSYYYRSEDQEAGRFIRRNVARFGDRDGVKIGLERTNFEREKQVKVVSTPSDVLQCKALYAELDRIYDRQGFVDKETAIVLTDESLLIPVLHSIPDRITNLNVTMGYPLISTVPYVLLERLLMLHKHQRNGEFAYGDVMGILSHPYVVEREGEAARTIRSKMDDWQSLWVPVGFFSENELLKQIFRVVNGQEEMQQYLEEVVSGFGAVESADAGVKERKEFIFTILEHILKLGETIRECGIEMDTGIYISLLRQTLQQVRIPYEGEPLSGLQIMGILETRNLDFDNVILLSLTDDTFPGNREGSSYIPFNLRQAFGLPTPQDHEAMYAYYFYRLIARCGDLTMMYSSSSDDQRTGEQSRYIYQLEYESPHRVERENVNLRVDYRPVVPIRVEKTPEIASRLERIEFSPTAINHYVTCPLKFYFATLERLEAPEQVSSQITALDVGNTLHRTMELLYKPLVGQKNVVDYLGDITADDLLAATERAIGDVMGMRGGKIEASGRMQLHRDIVMRYARNIIGYDARRYGRGFEIQSLERKAKYALQLSNGREVVLSGRADRVDRREDGVLQIVDYKSGGDKTDFLSVEGLFTDEGVNRQGEVCYQPHNGAVLQTMIYALIFGAKARAEAAPALYVARRMEAPDFSPHPLCKAGRGVQIPLDRLLSEHITELTRGLERLFGELFDVSLPFVQTEYREKCAYCDFRTVCKR